MFDRSCKSCWTFYACKVLILCPFMFSEATRIQFPVTCLAVVLTLSGFVCSIVGNFKKDKKTIFAAVCYILSGKNPNIS